MDLFSENIYVFVFFVFCRRLKMAYLLIFVILLHLLTLAMLFIATMEKVVRGGIDRPGPSGAACQLSCALCLISLSSPGGSGADWRTQTCGTTAASTTSQEFGCARPPKKLVKEEELHKMQLVAPEIRGGFLFCRVASGGAGADGPLRGLLLRLLFGVPGPALHHVQGRTLLLHWTVSSLRRYQLSLTMCR